MYPNCDSKIGSLSMCSLKSIRSAQMLFELDGRISFGWLIYTWLHFLDEMIRMGLRQVFDFFFVFVLNTCTKIARYPRNRYQIVLN